MAEHACGNWDEDILHRLIYLNGGFLVVGCLGNLRDVNLEAMRHCWWALVFKSHLPMPAFSFSIFK